MWFGNVQVNQHTLYGWSILALGRAGKVAAFFGGMTVVLDLIGPERIRQFGQRYQGFKPSTSRRFTWVLVIVGVLFLAFYADLLFFKQGLKWLFSWPMLALALLGLACSPGISTALVRGIATLLERPRSERVVRWVSVILLIAGFHFDLLAS
jgi:hypothetical protein